MWLSRLVDCFWHHFLFMRYSIRNRICWEEFVNSSVIRFHPVFISDQMAVLKCQICMLVVSSPWWWDTEYQIHWPWLVSPRFYLKQVSNHFSPHSSGPWGVSPKVNDLQKVNAACTTYHPPLGSWPMDRNYKIKIIIRSLWISVLGKKSIFGSYVVTISFV